MFGKPVKTECVRVLAVARLTSPAVSKTTKSQEVVAMGNPYPTALVSPL
jgi:hypothetical protein